MVGVTPRPRHALPAVVVLLGLLTGACADDPEPGPPEESPSSTPSASETQSPSDSASSTVKPATGVLLDPGGATMRAPEGFKLMDVLADFNRSANLPGSTTYVGLTVLPSAKEGDLDVLARLGIERFDGKAKRLPDREIADVTFYHLAGENAVGIHQDQFATAVDQKVVTLTFSLDTRDFSAQEREEIVEAGIASFAWSD